MKQTNKNWQRYLIIKLFSYTITGCARKSQMQTSQFLFRIFQLLSFFFVCCQCLWYYFSVDFIQIIPIPTSMYYMIGGTDVKCACTELLATSSTTTFLLTASFMTIRLSWYQNVNLLEFWHSSQIITTNISTISSFWQAGCPSSRPTNSVRPLMAQAITASVVTAEKMINSKS